MLATGALASDWERDAARPAGETPAFRSTAAFGIEVKMGNMTFGNRIVRCVATEALASDWERDAAKPAARRQRSEVRLPSASK
jgi:hypothetical protein